MYLCGPGKHNCQPFCGPEGRFYCSDSVCSLWPAPFSYLCVSVMILGVLKTVCGWTSKTWLLPYACCGLHFIDSAACVLSFDHSTPLHIYYYLGGTDIYYYQYILLLFIFYLVTPVQMKNLLMVRHHPHHHHHPCPDCLRGFKPTTMKRPLHPLDLFHNVLQNHLLDLQHRTSENPDPAGCTIGSLTRVIPFPRVTNHKTVPLFIIIIKVFLRCKILSLETILSAHTHIRMHACMHAYTHTHTHMEAPAHTVILTIQGSKWWETWSG